MTTHIFMYNEWKNYFKLCLRKRFIFSQFLFNDILDLGLTKNGKNTRTRIFEIRLYFLQFGTPCIL